MNITDVVVIAPFRRPTFRTAISKVYPVSEPWDSPPLIITGEIHRVGLSVVYYPLINIMSGFDEDTDHEFLLNLIKDNPAKIYLFSTDYFIPSRSTAAVYGMKIISKIVKEVHRNSLIGTVGRLSTVLKKRLFGEVPQMDFSVVGEPEETISDILNTILDEGMHSAFEKFNSICVRDSDREPVPCVVNNIENMALPAYNLLGPAFELYKSFTGREPKNIPFSMRTSFGCKFKCKFCSGVPNWLNYRKKSAGKVEREVQFFKEHIGNRGYICFLEDEIFTRDEEHVIEVSKVFSRNNIFLEGLYTHSTLLNERIAVHLQPITNRVYLGLDNPNDSILRKMSKGQNLDIVLSAIEIARNANLKVHLEWIIGTPEETVDSLITSLGSIFNFLNTGVVDNINTYVYCPHPGTEYAERCAKYNFDIVAGLEDMQESGGYPSVISSHVNREQVFIAYLMSQLLISEVRESVRLGKFDKEIRNVNKKELRRIFNLIHYSK
ncbi:B12-binding domain-containing radical SAM protein [Shouchella lonarensis]|uniref:Radical SAM superfamily enzyme YgiQ, UPF0313 family n=1 Tax=Shouchella lonarensis TaxID=1464122 RepID=A0A1G6N1I6_9BACI|nr:radical SAM protein [Shouchella lonarensis]SDC61561.1 Radical SAM superfamily enzyme YgiQ, UPF0313 family [Shouchella lonarensis]